MPIPVTAALTAVLGVLLVALAGNVSRQRIRHRLSLGEADNPVVLRAVRAHANAAEHVPIYLLLSLAAELSGVGAQLLAITGGVFVLARLGHVAGMVGRGLHRARQLGALGTYACQLLLSLVLLWRVALA